MATNMSSVPSINSSSNSLLIAVIVISALAVILNAGYADEKPIDARPISSVTLASQPGRILTLSFRVANNTDETKDLVEGVQLPPNWLSLISGNRYSIAAHKSQVRLTAFQVPRDCPAGKYTGIYSTYSAKNPSMREDIPISITVSSITKLAAIMEDAPDNVIAGDEFKARVRVVNEGNAPIDVHILAENHQPGFPAVAEPSAVSIPTGESTVVIVTAKTDRRQNRMMESLVQIRAISAADNGRSASANLNVIFNIIPRTSGNASPYNYIPSQIEYRTKSLSGGSAGQVSWVGGGAIEESSTDTIDFKLQTSGGSMSKTLGWRDEYSLGYSSKDVRVNLGDHTYGFSYLTDYMHYGSGVSIDLRSSTANEFGMYYMKPPVDSLDQGAAGIYLQRYLGGNADVKLNLFEGDKYSSYNKADVSSQIVSLETTAKPLPNLNVHAEYGLCSSDRDPSDSAYRIELNDTISRKADFSFQTTHAGADYYGYYQDRDYTSGSVNIPLSARLQANASYSTWQSNLDRRAELGTSPKEAYTQCDFHYDLRNRWYTDIGLGIYRRDDMMSPADFNYVESPLRLTLGNTGKKYTWLMELRDGERKDYLAHTTSSLQACRFFASYQPSPKQVFTLYADRSNINGGGYLFPGGNSIGFSASVKPSERFSLVAWYTNYAYTDALLNSNQLELSATYTERDDRTWNLRVQRFNPGTPSADTTVEILYTIPMSLPVSVRKDIGAVKGRVYDVQKDGRPGIANVLLYLNGLSSVTDENGEFSFPSLPGGTYSLKVDPKSIGLDRVTEIKMPLTVQVTTRKTTTVDLGVTDEVSVSGSVLMEASPTEIVRPESTDAATVYATNLSSGSSDKSITRGSQPSPSGLQNVIVELSSDSETIRRVTDHIGSFSFDDLRPGNWTLRVMKYNLPSNCYLENPEVQLFLRPGERRSIAINVLPRVRQIKMIGHETILSDEKERIPTGG
jgi:hypothetical protein